MSLKHSLKILLREGFARVTWHTGLWRLFHRFTETRLLILYGHCVDQPETNGVLAPDMKIDGERLESMLRALGRSFDLVTVGEGAQRLASGDGDRSMVALSMDDGYRDNLHDLVPLLERARAKATVFLEGGAVGERRLPWLHALGHLQRSLGLEETARRMAVKLEPQGAALTGAAGDGNRQKRILKYDADPDQRDAALLALVEETGADPGSLVDELYLSHVEAAKLAAAGPVELGGHTLSHPVLARLSAEEQRAEIQGGRDALAQVPGLEGMAEASFAYPYGRRWDFDHKSPEAVKAAGYSLAVTTHAGVNRRSTDPFRMARWPIHNRTRLHLIGTEASGAFDWLRRLGIDLVE